MSPQLNKTNKMTCMPIEDCMPTASAQSYQSALSIWRRFGSLATLKAHSNSDQTGQMPRLIRVLAGPTCDFLGFIVLRLIYDRFKGT